MASSDFGTYRLVERIAVGGTAEVFRAARLLAGGKEEPLVLKKILPQHARDERFRTLFEEEALVMASLKHDNIVGIRDFGEVQGTLFLALEYVDGADLDTLLSVCQRAEIPVTPPMAAWITREICAALNYIHTRKSSHETPLGIVHRDISPHNILVSRRGEVKLADFGIAKSIIRADQTTRGTIKGKFAYMSPEQATPGAVVDSRSDLFSLAAVLYEMLFGQPPFCGLSEVDTLERVRRCTFPLEEDSLEQPHRPLLRVLTRCLRRDPGERYADAAGLGDDLRQYLDQVSDPINAEVIGAWVRQAVEQSADGGVSQLVHDLFDTGQKGGTAIVAQVPRGPAAATPRIANSTSMLAAEDTHSTRLPALERPPRAPVRWLQLLVVALAASGLTLVLTWRFIARAPAEAPSLHGQASAAVGATDAQPATPLPPSREPDAAVTASSLPASTIQADARTVRAPARHRVLIRSTPSRAIVLVNGSRVGRSPVELGAPVDPFLVEVRHPGYRPFRKQLPAPTGPIRLHAQLQAIPRGHGGLTINSIPWARVYVDGRLLGTTPLRAVSVPVGRHRVTLKDRGGKTLRTFVTQIHKGHTKVFSFDQSRP